MKKTELTTLTVGMWSRGNERADAPDLHPMQRQAPALVPVLALHGSITRVNIHPHILSRATRGRFDEDDVDPNPGNNLFVTGLSRDCKNEELNELFEKFGEIEKCNIMKDPHTQESRGFAFVNFYNAEHANTARDSLSGTEFFGRILKVETAKRAGARKSTPGEYRGPSKREPCIFLPDYSHLC